MSTCTPWTNWQEWTSVFEKLYINTRKTLHDANYENNYIITDPCCPTSINDNESTRAEFDAQVENRITEWEKALESIIGWRSRKLYCPLAIDATFELLTALVFDWNHLARRRTVSEQSVIMVYGTAVTRCVNYVVDSLQVEEFAQSISELGASVGIPRWVIEVRHQIAHGMTMPSLELLRSTTNQLFMWLKGYYWDKQRQVLDNSEKFNLTTASKQCQGFLASIQSKVQQNSTSGVDDMVDMIIKLIPDFAHVQILVPKLCTVLIDSMPVETDVQLDHVLPWERVICGLADHYDGLAWNMIVHFCDRILLTENVSNSVWRGGFGLIHYFLSRRWHSLENEAAASMKNASVNPATLHPKQWTEEQKNWMWGIASPRFQDKVTLAKWLGVAIEKPGDRARQIVEVLLCATRSPKLRKKSIDHTMASQYVHKTIICSGCLNQSNSTSLHKGKNHMIWDSPAIWNAQTIGAHLVLPTTNTRPPVTAALDLEEEDIVDGSSKHSSDEERNLSSLASATAMYEDASESESEDLVPVDLDQLVAASIANTKLLL